MEIKFNEMEDTRTKISYDFNNITKEALIILESYLLDNCKTYTISIYKSDINTETNELQEVYWGWFESDREITPEDVKRSALNIW